MKHIAQLGRFAVLSLVVGSALSAQAQLAVNRSGAAPNTHAMLDLSDLSKGLLIPRMNAVQRNYMSSSGVPVVNTLNFGLLVYQTDSSTVAGPPGYYYFDNLPSGNTGWKHIPYGSRYWQVGGNTGTNPTNDFIGTTNAQPLIMRTTAIERARIAATGQFQIGATTAATEAVEVAGAIRMSATPTANPNPGTIRYTGTGTVASPGTFEGYVDNTALGGPTGWFPLENVLGARKAQDYPNATAGCDPPTNGSSSAAAVTAGPRPWPTIGTAQFQSSSTTETPYSGLWEDTRHNYLYLSSDFAATGICPGTPITALAFNVGTPGNKPLHYLHLSMKNTTTSSITQLDAPNVGFTLCSALGVPSTIPDPSHTSGFVVTNGWNVHDFNVASFTWNGLGYNVMVDFSEDDQEWSNGTYYAAIWMYNTSYNSYAGLFCDACGHDNPGGVTCGWTPSCPTMPQTGTHAASGMCTGWGWRGGWDMYNGMSQTTCDGTFQYSGGLGNGQRLPQIALRANYVGGGLSTLTSDYMYAQQAMMVGSTAWSTSGSYPNLKFKGPGTLSAEKSVWGAGLLLSDHVFDTYYGDEVKPEDAKGAADYVHYPVDEMAKYVERERHLPTIDGRNAWNATGSFSTDKLGTQLWVTVEEQSLYIKELNERMDALQQFLVEKRLNELKVGNPAHH